MFRKLVVLNVILTILCSACVAIECREYGIVDTARQLPPKELIWEERDIKQFVSSNQRSTPPVTTLNLKTADLEDNPEVWERLTKNPLPFLRQIILSGEWKKTKKGVDSFLKNLSQNQTLKSLMSIDASCSDVSIDALSQLRTITLSNDDVFVRDMPSFSGRYNCALIPLYIDLNGVILDRDDLIRLSKPRENTNFVQYRVAPDEATSLAFFALIIR